MILEYAWIWQTYWPRPPVLAAPIYGKPDCGMGFRLVI